MNMSQLRTFLQTGFVGLLYSIKLARMERRMQRLNQHIAAERDLHREYLAQLYAERAELAGKQLSVNVAAGQFAAAWAQASTGSKP